MSELVPTPVPAQGSAFGTLTDPAGGTPLERVKSFTAQPAVKKTIPFFIGVAALGGVALTWSLLSTGPQRTLYSTLDDSERASVVAALDKAAIPYRIDNQTGALTVNEGDLYKARMTVAQDGALATPDSGDDMLNNLPIGASRTLEGERLRSAKERELMMTIGEIDGVESVRVHLAQGEKSAFIRDTSPPSASVMLKLARGRQLSDNQVMAITNLVASSIPGLSVDQVKVIDQHGRLLTSKAGNGDGDRLELQTRMEEKLRNQLSSLLAPMIGEGNFSTQIQVDLDMDQVTSARESYEKQGAIRTETQQQSQSTTTGAGTAAGVPGVLSNSPPPAATPSPGAPGQATVQQGTLPVAGAAAAPQSNGESSASRTYELGREVAVSNAAPGKVKRVSVAVALSAEAMKGGKAGDADQIKQLVSAAIGADAARGDQVAVVVRKFDKVADESVPFYEASWFADVLRYGVGLLGVLLVLLLGVRPLIKAFRPEKPAKGAADEDGSPANGPSLDGLGALPMPAAAAASHDPEMLGRQVSLAQRMVEEQPESAVIALRRMLQASNMEPAR
ncbi:MAG: flagellar basal-body MS-ring/collar protein FliF [Novosphingobium sp.]